MLTSELRERRGGCRSTDSCSHQVPVEPGISLPPDPASSEAEPDPWEYLDGHRARRLVLGGLLGSESPFSTVAACYSHGSPLDHGRLLNGFANALSWAC